MPCIMPSVYTSLVGCVPTHGLQAMCEICVNVYNSRSTENTLVSPFTQSEAVMSCIWLAYKNDKSFFPLITSIQKSAPFIYFHILFSSHIKFCWYVFFCFFFCLNVLTQPQNRLKITRFWGDTYNCKKRTREGSMWIPERKRLTFTVLHIYTSHFVWFSSMMTLDFMHVSLSENLFL